MRRSLIFTAILIHLHKQSKSIPPKFNCYPFVEKPVKSGILPPIASHAAHIHRREHSAAAFAFLSAHLLHHFLHLLKLAQQAVDISTFIAGAIAIRRLREGLIMLGFARPPESSTK